VSVSGGGVRFCMVLFACVCVGMEYVCVLEGCVFSLFLCGVCVCYE